MDCSINKNVVCCQGCGRSIKELCCACGGGKRNLPSDPTYLIIDPIEADRVLDYHFRIRSLANPTISSRIYTLRLETTGCILNTAVVDQLNYPAVEVAFGIPQLIPVPATT